MTPLNMLDPGGIETRGGQSLSMGNNFRNAKDPKPPQYVHAVHKNSTVKELLRMRRQKRSSPLEDNNMETRLKSARSEVSGDMNNHLFGPPSPVNFNIMNQCALVNGHITPQPVQHPAPPADVKMTLFYWQIQQEEQKLGAVSPELLNMQDADGDTFLHIAAAQGRRALVYVLATKMAACGSLDVKERNGQTALQVAAATNQHLIVQDLLTLGAQVNTRDHWGRSPLHVCAEKGHVSSLQSIWKTLTGSGQPIDLEMFNYDGLTPLHAAVLAHNAVIKELRKLENPCSYMTTELLQRRQKFGQCIQMLLLMGALPGTKDLKSGRTCLHMASDEANVELVSFFLDQPSSLSLVNVKTFNGNTALHIASSLANYKRQVEAVKLLMKHGADPGAKNLENELPSQLVPQGPMGEKVRQILKGKYFHA